MRDHLRTQFGGFFLLFLSAGLSVPAAACQNGSNGGGVEQGTETEPLGALQDTGSESGRVTLLPQEPAAGGSFVDSGRILGAGVRNEEGAQLAVLSDLVIMAREGRAESAVLALDASGQQKLVSVPFQRLSWNGQAGQFTTDMTAEQLEKMPEFNPAEFQGRPGGENPQGSSAQAAPSRLLANQLKMVAVRAAGEEPYGTVTQLVLAMDSRDLGYVIVTPSANPGGASGTLPVPWAAVHVSRETPPTESSAAAAGASQSLAQQSDAGAAICLSVEKSAAELAGAPTIKSGDALERLNEPKLRERIDEFYGVKHRKQRTES